MNIRFALAGLGLAWIVIATAAHAQTVPPPTPPEREPRFSPS